MIFDEKIYIYIKVYLQKTIFSYPKWHIRTAELRI